MNTYAHSEEKVSVSENQNHFNKKVRKNMNELYKVAICKHTQQPRVMNLKNFITYQISKTN